MYATVLYTFHVLAVQVAAHLENAVTSALDAGYRTGDLASEGTTQVGCMQMGEILESYIPGGVPVGTPS